MILNNKIIQPVNKEYHGLEIVDILLLLVIDAYTYELAFWLLQF